MRKTHKYTLLRHTLITDFKNHLVNSYIGILTTDNGKLT